jgi:hypothetical protein
MEHHVTIIGLWWLVRIQTRLEEAMKGSHDWPDNHDLIRAWVIVWGIIFRSRKSDLIGL